MGGKTKASFRPRIKLEIKNQIIEDLANGVDRKEIADRYQISQTFITQEKDTMPLFAYCRARKWSRP